MSAYFDKPDWIQHGGTAILGVDIDHSNERLVTCGSDNKIRIWSMRPVAEATAEADSSVPRQLAVLSEFTAPVNCVRFAPATAPGRQLVAGSDDSDAYVFELREGRGAAVFGSGEAANLENWRLRLRLRGHEANVTDVAWAPDGRRLATASIDNRVKIWDAASGHCLRTLEGHAGHVKGVAWDPFDVYLASQGDREAIVWRLEDGAVVARVDKPFAAAPIASFALRPCWSPDGQSLALPNGLDNGVPSAPILRRNAWKVGAGDYSLVGHRGPVTAVRYNPHLYTAPRKRRGNGDGDGEATGDGDDGAAGAVTAIGSIDKSFSIWHPSLQAPLVVGRGFCDRMLNDMAWSPDGRLLAVASQDGSVTTVVLGEGDLGRRLPEADMQALLAQLYGDPRHRNAKAALTAAPDLLQLEARARADDEREERLSSRLGPGAAAAQPPRPPATAAAPGPSTNGSLTQASRAATEPQPAAAAPQQTAAAAPPPQQHAPAAVIGTQRSSSPAKAVASGVGGRAAAGTGGRDPDAPPAPKRVALQPVQVGGNTAQQAPGSTRPAAAAGLRSAASGAFGGGTTGAAVGDGHGATAPGATATPGPDPQHAVPGWLVPGWLVPPPPPRELLHVILYAQTGPGSETQVSMELQALNTTSRDARQRPVGELVCLRNGQRHWSDAVQGHIVALGGSSRLAAASTTTGDLLVFSPAGRRLFPPIRLGPPAAFLSVGSGSSTLLALTADGVLRTWDFAAGEALLETSVAPLLMPAATGGQGPPAAAAQGLTVSGVRLSAAGAPVVVLSNSHAYVHHAGLRCWMRVADDAFPASVYTAAIAPGSAGGELSRLQAPAAQRRHPRDVLSAHAAHVARPLAAVRSEQAALEHNLAAAAALQSPSEWRQWLTTYVRRLTADEDELRLRDLISELLGPLRWTAPSHAAPPPAGTGRAGGSGAGEGPPPLASAVVGRWQPVILGFDKRRLLREAVLKEVAKNRGYQQLVAEVLDQLKLVEAPPAAAATGAVRGAAACAPPQEVGPGAPAEPRHGFAPPPAQHHQPMVLG